MSAPLTLRYARLMKNASTSREHILVSVSKDLEEMTEETVKVS